MGEKELKLNKTKYYKVYNKKHLKHQLIQNKGRGMQIQNKVITRRKIFFSQKVCALILFVEGVDVGFFFKKLDERLAIRDQSIVRVR